MKIQMTLNLKCKRIKFNQVNVKICVIGFINGFMNQTVSYLTTRKKDAPILKVGARELLTKKKGFHI